MNIKAQKACAIAGMLTPWLMFFAMIVSNFFPPLQPSLDVHGVTAFYQDNAARIRFGGAIMQIAGGLMIVFTAAISAQLRRVESRNAPVLSYVQMGAGFVTAVPFIIPALIWITASFRPDRSPELTLLMSDLGWIIFIGFWFPTPVQNFATAFVILSDKKANPTFPRWVGWFCIWDSLIFPPAMIMPFFTTGPFAWNGLFAFWLPGAAFAAWFVVMFIYLMKAINRQETEEKAEEKLS